jgi:hypothetical protein
LAHSLGDDIELIRAIIIDDRFKPLSMLFALLGEILLLRRVEADVVRTVIRWPGDPSTVHSTPFVRAA